MDSERSLIKRARKGDQAAWEALLKKCQPLIKLHAFKWFCRGHEYNECLSVGHEIFMESVRKHRVKRGANLNTYLSLRLRDMGRRVCNPGAIYVPGRAYKNHSDEAVLARQTASIHTLITEMRQSLGDTLVSPSELTEQQEILYSVIERLAPREKTITQLRIYGYTYSEIGERVGIGERQVAKEWKRILEKLRELCLLE